MFFKRKQKINTSTPLYRQLTEYLDYCENVRRMSKQTLHSKEWVCKQILKDFRINDISELSNKQINDWIAEQTARGCAGRTINGRLVNLVAMIRYFQDMGTPFPELRLRLIVKCKEEPPRRVYYSKEQISQVLRYCDHEEWLMIKLCFDCGLRISELRNLRIRNIDGRRVSFVGKGSKQRESYMSEETRERLTDWLERHRVEDYLWTKPNGKPLSVEEIRYLMRQPFYAAGFKDFYPHALRHSFATDVVNNGAPLEVAKEMLGHARIETTERYVHSLEGHLESFFDDYKFASR